MPQAVPADAQVPVHDADHYVLDGNTVVQVENTLFRVHRSMLVKDNSTFDGLFSLDQIKSELCSSEGQDDSSPIRLQGDTAAEFRALLWALYALPAELVQSSPPHSDEEVQRFIHLARITHKYQFGTTERWALQALAKYVKSQTSQSIVHLEQLTEVASLCCCTELLNDAVAKWRQLLGEGKDVGVALSVGERLGLKKLTGLAYHRMMVLGRETWDADPHLQRNQRIRLLSGHYTLTRMGEDLPAQPPAFVHDMSCAGVNLRRCSSGWTRVWEMITTKKGGLSEQIMVLQTADILGRLMFAESVLKAVVDGDIPHNDMMDGMSDMCHEPALKATQKKLKEVQKQLVEFFTDVV